MRGVACRIGFFMALVGLQAQAADPWQNITKENQPQLPGNEIQFIKKGKTEGQVWIGTLGGLAMVEGGVLHPVKATKGMNVWDITPRPEGGYWIGHNAGALLMDGERSVAALGGKTVAPIQAVGTQLWAIAKNNSQDHNSLVQAEGEGWGPVALFKDRNVQDLVQDSKGVFWLVLDGDGVIELDPAKGLKEFHHHLARMNVTSIMTDSKGITWCGLWGGGVMVEQDKAWKRHLATETSAVLTLIEGGDGKIWAATSGNGVWLFDGKDWKGMLQEEGSVNLLTKTSDGRIWISTQKSGGLRFWNGKEWQVSLEGPLPIRCLMELPKGVLVAGGVLDGLHILGEYSIKGE